MSVTAQDNALRTVIGLCEGHTHLRKSQGEEMLQAGHRGQAPGFWAFSGNTVTCSSPRGQWSLLQPCHDQVLLVTCSIQKLSESPPCHSNSVDSGVLRSTPVRPPGPRCRESGTKSKHISHCSQSLCSAGPASPAGCPRLRSFA